MNSPPIKVMLLTATVTSDLIHFMSDWNYYGNKALRAIGVSNETQDISAWIGNKRREIKAYCKSKSCNSTEYGKKLILVPEEDDTCPNCGDYLFFCK